MKLHSYLFVHPISMEVCWLVPGMLWFKKENPDNKIPDLSLML